MGALEVFRTGSIKKAEEVPKYEPPFLVFRRGTETGWFNYRVGVYADMSWGNPVKIHSFFGKMGPVCGIFRPSDTIISQNLVQEQCVRQFVTAAI